MKRFDGAVKVDLQGICAGCLYFELHQENFFSGQKRTPFIICKNAGLCAYLYERFQQHENTEAAE